MKKILLLLCSLMIVANINAQTINIPDAKFKTFLLNGGTKDANGNTINIDLNNDGEIQVAETIPVKQIIIYNNYDILSVTGIKGFKELEKISIVFTNIPNIDVEGLSKLKYLAVLNSKLTSINVENHTNLEYLDLSYNNLSSINVNGCTNLKLLYLFTAPLLTNVDVSSLLNLEKFGAPFGGLVELDLSKNSKLTNVAINTSPNLKTLLVKNGSQQTFLMYNTPKLQYICCDESELSEINSALSNNGNLTCTVVTSCATALNATEFEEFSKINIVQNPVQDILTLKSNHNINSIEIYDISGRLVKSESKVTNNQMIVTDLKSGNFIAIIKTDKNTFKTKFIKK